MPLERQNLELPLSGGLLQNVDERVLPAGRWASVSNLLPVRQGALTKRPGYGLIPRGTYPPGDTIAEVVDVIDSRRDELLIYGHRYGASRMWSWSETLERWIDKDDVSPCSVLVQPVASAYVGTLMPRVSVTASGAIAWAWQYLQGPTPALGSVTTVQRVEEANGAVRQDETAIYASVGILNTEQVSVGDEVVTLYTDAGGPLLSRVTDTLTGAISAPIAVVTPNPVFRFAACPYDATTYLLAWVDSGVPTSITIWQLDTSGALISGFTHVLGGGAISAVCIDAIAGLGAVLTYWDLINGVRTMRLADLTWTAVWGPQTDVAGAVSVVSLGSCIDTTDTVTSCASVRAAVNTPIRTVSTNRDPTGTPFFLSEAQNTIIEHQPFRREDGAFVTMTQVSPDETRYGATCLVQVGTADAPSVVATIDRTSSNAGTGALFAVGSTLARAIPTGNTAYILPLSVLTGGGAAVGPNAFNVGVSSCTFDFSQRQSALRWGAEQRDCLAHSGGMTGWYDGTCEVETGYVSGPVIQSYTPAAAGGNMVDGSYLYCVVWEWRDERGNLHQSAPSLPLRVVLTGGTATQQVTLTVETLALTRKGDVQDGVAKDVTLQVYRTADNGSLFIRETKPKGGTSDAVINNKSFPTVSYLDTLNDGQLQALGYGFLYTTGDVLENQMAPAARAIVSTKNRLWLASAENPRELWFSKLIVNGEGPGFNGSLVLTLDDANDEITALAALDDKVIVFTRKRIYYVSGDGPNDTGGGGGFQGPLRLPSDVGCSDQRSVVTYPEGVVYWDGDQIARLTRGLTMEPFGDPVLDVTGGSYGVIGKLDPAAQRIHFLVYRDLPARADKNIFAVHDYRFGQWATHTQYGTNGDFDGPALVVAHHWHNGQHWLSHGDGEESTLGRTRFDLFSGYDTDVWFPATLETPWIHVAGVNGYQRAWDVTFTGKQLTQHRLIVEVFTDYDLTTIRQRMVCDVQAGSPMLGLPVERLSLLLRSQLCSAVKFRIYDEAPDDPIVAQDPTGWDIAGLTIGLGIKPGGARLPARNRG